MRQLDDLHAMLSEYRFSIANEDALQTQVFYALRDQRLSFRREVHLSAVDRIDFMVDLEQVDPLGNRTGTTSIGVELKIGGSLAALTRQGHRYLQHDELGALLVITTRSQHNRMPEVMNGKPIRVLHLLGSSF